MTIPEYPFQEGSSLSAAGINYNSLKAMKAMKMLEELKRACLFRTNRQLIGCLKRGTIKMFPGPFYLLVV
jgi:hypothetical protein